MHRVTIWRQKAKRDMVKHMGGECWICDEDDPVCMDFHHINPDNKTFGLSSGKANCYSKARREAELEKCIMLCANCHRKLHSVVRQM